MKRCVSILLVILSLVSFLSLPSAASAAIEGKTVDDFLGWIADNYPGYFTSHETVYQKRVLFAAAVDSGSSGMEMLLGFTYKNSDIIEFMLVGGDDLSVYFLASMSDAAIPQSRVDEAAAYISSISGNILQVLSDKWSRSIPVGNYYLETRRQQDGGSGLVFMWLHNKSKQKNKDTATRLFSGDKYPLSAIIADLAAAPSTPQTTLATADGITLSSGEWLCPDHIPAGEYVVKPVKSAGIAVWRGDMLIANEYLSADDQEEIGRLVLQDGDTIKVSSGKLVFSPFAQ